MANYANEYAEPSDIVRKGGPVTKQNVTDAIDQIMFIKVVSLLLGNQDCNDEGISVERQRDLGRLFFFLAGQPSDVLVHLESEYRDDNDDPDPGKEKPILTTVEATNNQAVGGAS